jgi:hypothetical protein
LIPSDKNNGKKSQLKSRIKNSEIKILAKRKNDGELRALKSELYL